MPPPRLAVVLVRPHTPGNLGSAARAARNFGAPDLRLIEPAAPVDEESRRLASGADDVLDGLRRFESLAEATADFDAVVATSSLRGREEQRFLGLGELPGFLAELGPAARVAFVFGPERSGLTEQERSQASACLRLPTRPDFPTLNLSHAVAVVLAMASLSEPRGAIARGSLGPGVRRRGRDRTLGPRARGDRLLRHGPPGTVASGLAPDRRLPPDEPA